jgi:effector-binding domain-containing protein
MPFRLPVVLFIAALALPLGSSPAPARNPDAAAVSDPDSAARLTPGDAFGAEVTLPKRMIIYLNGHTTWDNVFAALANAFKALDAHLKKAGIKPEGPAMTIYVETDDNGFKFRAARPITQAPGSPPTGDVAVGEAPEGKALKFVHRGTYEAIDATYEAITNYLDDKGIEARNEFIEEYVSDLTSGPGDMVINVLVPVK